MVTASIIFQYLYFIYYLLIKNLNIHTLSMKFQIYNEYVYMYTKYKIINIIYIYMRVFYVNINVCVYHIVLHESKYSTSSRLILG